MEAELELGDDAEVAAAAAHSPEEVGVLRRARLHELALGGDQVHATSSWSIVSPYLRWSQPMPPPERQSRDAGVRDDPARRREPERLGLAVELAPAARRPAPARCAPRDRRGSLSSGARSITMPPSQTDRPGKLWPPPRTATCRSVALARPQRRDHVGDAGAARDQRRAAVDRAVPDLAVLVVAPCPRAGSAARGTSVSSSRSAVVIELHFGGRAHASSPPDMTTAWCRTNSRTIPLAVPEVCAHGHAPPRRISTSVAPCPRCAGESLSSLRWPCSARPQPPQRPARRS